ncbi:MAG: CHAP domain-containing protein [Verrucomicrobiaceae bacterium]|nr:MAG: CHAP domain-containing protein [Verrucomicrobiaceae bacterium]
MPTLPLRQKLISIARSQIGVREEPRNSNSGGMVRKYQSATTLDGTGWPWCAAFVCWAIREWGKYPDVREALRMSAAEFEKWRPKTAAAYGFDGWAKKRGLLVHSENANPGGLILHTGDIVTYDFSHVGLIETDRGDTLHTIEGNTDAAGSREGGGVYQKRRDRKLARTIIRILP